MSSVAAPATPSRHVDETGTELVARARIRSRLGLPSTEEALAFGLAGAFTVTAVSFAAFLPSVRPFSPVAAAIAVVVYAIVSRVEFEVSNGIVAPTQVVLIPMLFALPPRTVPLVVAVGLLAGQIPNIARGKLSLSHLPLSLASASYAFGPVLVLSIAGARSASWSGIALYFAALGSQFAADFVLSAVWSRWVWGVSVVHHARSMRIPILVDTALAPVGLAVAIAAGSGAWSVLVALPLVALLQVFARERQVRIDHSMELGQAYRGTAMLLGDVIEADDEYTGSHSRDVVDLVLAVSDRLGLDPSTRRRTEFAALLHDVGKVKIPSEIINKPGALNDEERLLMNMHTLVGQAMLDRIGGLLGDVGRIVRSCHERWDGAGYPDMLAGEAIPLEARIVCACDAWSAMTTDRAYRAALSLEAATAELRSCSGTHFDPRVVDALAAVLGI